MSATANRPFVDRVLLRDVSWETYEHLLQDLEDQAAPRLAFDQGVLEIMTPHLEHEAANRAIAAIIETTLEELDLDFENAGSTTFKREAFRRGFEPDSCFYIRNVERVRSRTRLDLDDVAPPDLVIEIDLTSDSLDKFPLYAAFGVPEVWRYDQVLEIWTLEEGRYVRRDASQVLPVLAGTLITELLEARPAMRRPEWLRQVRRRVRSLLR